MQKFISVDPMEPGTVYENTGLLSGDDLSGDGMGGSSHDGDYLPPQAVGGFEMSSRPGEPTSSSSSSAPGATFSPMMMPAMGSGDVQAVAAPTTAGPPARNKERATKEPKSMKPK